MEDPTAWPRAERIIDNAITVAQAHFREGYIGASMPKQIADALREAGLLKEDDS